MTQRYWYTQGIEILVGLDLSILTLRVNYILTVVKEMIASWTICSYWLQILLKTKMSEVIQPHSSHSVSKKDSRYQIFLSVPIGFHNILPAEKAQ